MPVGAGYCRAFFNLLEWADLLHFHHPFPLQDVLFLLGRLVRRMPPSVVTYHSDVVRQRLAGHLYAPLARRFLRQVDRVVATSPEYLQTSPVLRQIGTAEVIPLGIDEAAYPRPTAQRRQALRAQYGEGFFLFIGALRYYKGLHWLVRAAMRNGLPVVIAGSGSEEASLRTLAAGAQNIHFTGRVSEEDKIALLSLARAFVFPSHLRSEAFGISLLEAQMIGLPLITCEIGTGTSHVNAAGVTGLVVPPADAEALDRAMRQLWADPTLCRRMGEAARHRFRTLFTAERMSSRYLDLYQRVLASLS